jgi:hypothetical protein
MTPAAFFVRPIEPGRTFATDGAFVAWVESISIHVCARRGPPGRAFCVRAGEGPALAGAQGVATADRGRGMSWRRWWRRLPQRTRRAVRDTLLVAAGAVAAYLVLTRLVLPLLL